MHRNVSAVSSDVVECRFQSRLRAMHRSRLREAKPVLDDRGPARYAHLEPATKAPAREQVWRNRTIAHDNGLLVDKMVHILARKPKPNHDTELLTKAAHATVEDAYRPGPIPLPKSLNKDARTRQLESIVLENERFLARLIASPGVYNKQQWEKQHEGEVQWLQQISRFPYQDPAALMPQVNPILAIAQAQSNKSAEWILRQQQAQMMQSGAFPPVNGALANTGALGQTQGFGSTFGSTTGTLPPPGQLPPMSGVPNHFPMPPPPSAGAYPSPSHVPMAPVPPSSARGANGGPKLRAQYTSQGVKILRSGRHHHPPQTARPATQQAASRPGTTSSIAMELARGSTAGGRTPKYAPLRQQQQQQQQSVTQAQGEKKGAAGGGAEEEQKENGAAQQQQQQQQRHPTTIAESQEEKQNDEGGDPSASSTAAGAPSTTGDQPPASDSSLKLFEDTLVISGRAVLIKIFECGGPPCWRLDLRVFDPWTSLEYTLSLPLTYVRLCFYQVPDLLLPANRPFLLQTLLHYLAFAPAASGDGSLELLVDIVAPQPRNPAEVAAWTRAHDEAAVEQAQAELEAEKAAAKHRAECERLQGEEERQRREEERQRREEERRREEEEFERLKANPQELAAVLQQQMGQEQYQQQQLQNQQEQQQPQPQPQPQPSSVGHSSPLSSSTSLASSASPSQPEETFVIHRNSSKRASASSQMEATDAAVATAPAAAAAAPATAAVPVEEQAGGFLLSPSADSSSDDASQQAQPQPTANSADPEDVAALPADAVATSDVASPVAAVGTTSDPPPIQPVGGDPSATAGSPVVSQLAASPTSSAATLSTATTTTPASDTIPDAATAPAAIQSTGESSTTASTEAAAAPAPASKPLPSARNSATSLDGLDDLNTDDF